MSTPAHDYDSAIEDVTTERRTAAPTQGRVFPLIRTLADDATTLLTKEIALLKAETTNALRETRAGIGAVATGAAVLYAGFLFLLLAAVLGLMLVMDAWLAALIVGAVVALVGAIMLATGKKKLEPAAFRPEHTRAALRKDRDMIKETINESHE